MYERPRDRSQAPEGAATRRSGAAPARPDHARILALQRATGNRAVARMVQERTTSSAAPQPSGGLLLRWPSWMRSAGQAIRNFPKRFDKSARTANSLNDMPEESWDTSLSGPQQAAVWFEGDRVMQDLEGERPEIETQEEELRRLGQRFYRPRS